MFSVFKNFDARSPATKASAGSPGKEYPPPIAPLSEASFELNKAKINFQRLLSRCEQYSLGKPTIELDRFEQYFVALQDMLELLIRKDEGFIERHSYRTSLERLSRYITARKQDLERKQVLNVRPAVAPSYSSSSSLSSSFSSSRRIATFSDIATAATATKSVMRSTLPFSSSSSSSSSPSSSSSSYLTASTAVTAIPRARKPRDDDDNRLFFPADDDPMMSSGGSSSSAVDDSQEQAELTADLLELADTLKSQVLRLRTSLRSDQKVVSEAASLLDGALPSVQQENDRLKTITFSGWCQMLSYWCALLVVAVTFMATLVFIKFFPKPRPEWDY